MQNPLHSRNRIWLAEQLDAFVRQTVEQIISVWWKKENQLS